MKPIPFVTAAEYRGEYLIQLQFDDGTEKTIDFRPMLQGPIFEPLLELAAFRGFGIEGGTIAWSNGADIAPETLHAAPDAEAAA